MCRNAWAFYVQIRRLSGSYWTCLTGHILMVLDIKPAFLYGETKRAIYLEVPDADQNGRNPQLVGKLHKALCGTRGAQQQGQEHLTTLKNIIGFKEVVCMSGDVKLDAQNVTLVVHVDDVVMVVAEDSLKMKRESGISEQVKNEILGPGRHHLRKVKCLGRHICWTDNRIEEKTKHIDQMLRDLGLQQPVPQTCSAKNMWIWSRPNCTAEVLQGLPTQAKTDPNCRTHHVLWILPWQIPHQLTCCG